MRLSNKETFASRFLCYEKRSAKNTGIQTVSKRGYRFVADVKLLPTEAETIRQTDPQVIPRQEVAAKQDAPHQEEALLSFPHATVLSPRKLRLRSLTAVSVVAVFVGILLASGMWP